MLTTSKQNWKKLEQRSRLNNFSRCSFRNKKEILSRKFSTGDLFLFGLLSKLMLQRLIPFSQASKTKDYEQWVHFYEKDEVILRVWNQPRKYLPMLKKFHGVISPDFSVQRNMPFILQAMSITMGRALGNFWQQNLIEVIPNVRFNGEKTYDIAFDGLDEHANLAIGTLGCLRNKEERKIFEAGLEEMMNRLHPHAAEYF